VVSSNLRRLGRLIRENLGTLLAVTSIAFTLVYVRYEGHLFCQVVSAATAVRVERPADPKAFPAREQQWEWYERFMSLGRSLGC
jgi:hypothetical protein